MLTKLEVRTDQGALLTLPLQDYSEGYVVEDITGLDPVNATIVSSSFAQLDGSEYQSSRRENRNLVIKLSFEPTAGTVSVQQLRSRLYGFFMPKSNVQLRFYEDTGLVVNISGRVESFVAPRFGQDPGATISIICFKPDFVEMGVLSFGGASTAGTTELVQNYDGSVETGFLFTMNINRAMSGFTIYSSPPDNSLRSLIFVAPLVAGDVVKISTVSGAKSAILTRGGVDGSILYGVSPYSNWMNLFPGPNKLRVQASGAAVPWSITYTNKYGGL